MPAGASNIAITPISPPSDRPRNSTACTEFGKALPKLRRRVEQDLKRRKMERETVLAAVVRLLDTEHIRIGNEQYAKDNKSFGATTLRSRHLRRKGGKMLMRFAGKHGIVHEVSLTDSHLKRIVKRCQELPGQMLFQYVNGDGEPQAGHLERRQRLYQGQAPAATSPPSISAPGARASSPSTNCSRRRKTRGSRSRR